MTPATLRTVASCDERSSAAGGAARAAAGCMRTGTTVRPGAHPAAVSAASTRPARRRTRLPARLDDAHGLRRADQQHAATLGRHGVLAARRGIEGNPPGETGRARAGGAPPHQNLFTPPVNLERETGARGRTEEGRPRPRRPF